MQNEAKLQTKILCGNFRQLEVEVVIFFDILIKEILDLNQYIENIHNVPLDVVMCLDKSDDNIHKCLAHQSQHDNDS